ncbi:MAG: hypothetical protein ACOYMP_09925 [Nodosilinea sp.]
MVQSIFLRTVDCQLRFFLPGEWRFPPAPPRPGRAAALDLAEGVDGGGPIALRIGLSL